MLERPFCVAWGVCLMELRVRHPVLARHFCCWLGGSLHVYTGAGKTKLRVDRRKYPPLQKKIWKVHAGSPPLGFEPLCARSGLHSVQHMLHTLLFILVS